MPRIAEIHIHPVKSLRGLSLERARFGPLGLDHDRRFALVDPAGGVFSAKYTKSLLSLSARLEGESLVLENPKDGTSRSVRLDESKVASMEAVLFARPLTVERYLDPDLDAWLSAIVGQRCHLARSEQGFFDLRPVSVQAQATTVELGWTIGMPLEIARFRPNLVIEDAPARAEDSWRSFEVGGVRFGALGRIERCNMTMIDPESLEVGPEPIASLAKRSSRPKLGAYFAPSASGELQVGQELHPR